MIMAISRQSCMREGMLQAVRTSPLPYHTHTNLHTIFVLPFAVVPLPLPHLRPAIH